MGQLSIFKAVLLGIIQGATEFLPVSSSAHLVISQNFLGINLDDSNLVAFDVCLHFGTLVAVVVFFWKDIIKIFSSFFCRVSLNSEPVSAGGWHLTDWEARRLGLMLILGTIPAVVFGVLFHDFFESLVSKPVTAAVMLLATGLILWFTRFAKPRDVGLAGMNWRHALAIGLAQSVAIIPGISRSGSTISTGLYLGLPRGLAARFSFLLSVVIIALVTVFESRKLTYLSHDLLISIIVGTIVAAVVGFLCIKWLLKVIERGRFSWFAYYCWAVGLSVIVFLGC